MREEGAILLVVLVALALLAALAGLVIRVAESDLSGLAAERALLRREALVASALASLGARLPAPDLAEDGSEVVLALPGGRVVARIEAASGLINPNFTRGPGIVAALTALGASPAEAEGLAEAMVSARQAANERAFTGMDAVAKLFRTNPDLWGRVAPYVTLSGRAEVIDPAHAPAALRGAALPQSAASVDFSGASASGARGFYEIWLHVEDKALDAADPRGRLWTHVSALIGRDHRLHVLAMGWPETMGAER